MVLYIILPFTFVFNPESFRSRSEYLFKLKFNSYFGFDLFILRAFLKDSYLLKKSLSILNSVCFGVIFNIHFCFKKDLKGIIPIYTFLAVISESIFSLSIIFEFPRENPRNLIPE